MLKESLEKKEVVVKADEHAKNAVVLKIMDAAQEAGYEKLIVAGEPLSKKEQNELKSNTLENDRELKTNVPSRPKTKERLNIPQDDDWND